MNRKKRTLAIIAVLLVLLIGLPCWLVHREEEQARKNQALIAAIKAEDTQRSLKLLSEGADGNAHDMGEVPSFGQVFLRSFDRFRHASPRLSNQSTDDEHLRTLLLLYHQHQQHWLHRSPEEDPGPDVALIRSLLDHHARVNDKDSDGWSPLFWSSEYSNVEVVRLLLERGADIEVVDDIERRTPLLETQEQADENAGVTQVLLEFGAKTEAADHDGRTALMNASLAGYIHTVRLLLAHGANVSHQDKHGWTALDRVKGNHYPEYRQIAALLRQYGAK